MLTTLLKHFPIYTIIIKYLDNNSILSLKYTCKETYNIICNFGYLKTIKLILKNKSIINKILNEHKRTIQGITISEIDNYDFSQLLNQCYKKLHLRIINCKRLSLSHESLIVTDLTLIGYQHGLSSDHINKFTSLSNLGVEHIKECKNTIKLNKLEILKIYGNLKLNLFKCQNILQCFYYITSCNICRYLDFSYYKKLQHIIIVVNYFTYLRYVIVPKSLKHIKIIVGNTIYEKKFFVSKIINQYSNELKHIQYNTHNNIIYPNFRLLNNMYL